jgi:RND family efflux transporter MFP subunit
MIWTKVQDEFDRQVVALKTAASNADARSFGQKTTTWLRQNKWLSLGLAAAALVGIGFVATRPTSANQPVSADSALPAVVTQNAKMERIAPQVALAGSVVSQNDAQLASDVEGRVASVAEVGTVVKQGDVIASLDSSVARMQLASDKANVAKLEAQLVYDRSQADRMNSLFAQAAIAKATRDQAISARDSDVGGLAAARAAAAKSQYDLDHDEIRAPFAGRVVQRLINPGEYATTGKAIVRLVDIATLEVSAQSPIQYSQYIHEGETLTSIIEDKPVAGVVRAIVPVGDQLSRTVEVRITLKPGSALVGDSARVSIPSSEPRNAIAVPRDALLLREEGTYLFKLDKNNTALRVAVEPGSDDGDLIEVQGPVAAGDRIVVRGGEHLEAGQKVRIKT